MKIVADENIPQVKHFFAEFGEVVQKPGRAISQTDLQDADILLVRSVTQVNQKLLDKTKVKFVGSTTTGFDHVDIAYLKQQGIQYSIAKGCNATAVVEYVICVIASLQQNNLLCGAGLRAGVIGAGEIGSQVAETLKILGFEVVLCDPLRAAQESDFQSTPIEQMKDLDLITIHTPLTHEGKFPTQHLIGKNFLQQQKSNCVLINTSRGAVIDFGALKQHGQHLHWCLDVWEQEPEVDLDILKTALIATPHIAGYSIQSKYRGIEMVYHAACEQKIIDVKKLKSLVYPEKNISCNNENLTWQDIILKIYNPIATTEHMKDALLKETASFDQLRKDFVERHEFRYVQLRNANVAKLERIILSALGMS